MNRKANAGVWLIGLGTLFVVGIMFLSMTPAFNTITNLPTSNFTTEQLSVWTQFQTTWTLWPALVIFGIIIYAFVWTVRTDTYGGLR